jgi:amidase
MEIHEYARLDATALAELIASGEVGAAEVEAVARRALERANERVNGLTMPPFDKALAHAADGPFAGVPFLIKDTGPVAEGVPFSIGTRAIPPHIVAEHDTEMMGRFRAAGLVTLGQTTAPEMAIGFATESARYGITRNPWNLERGVGGSSGGSAALVAAGAVPVAHGSDGAGSIRIPASACGLVGLKPTRGRTPSGPDADEHGFGMSYDFALTRTVRDAARLLDAVAGPGVGGKYEIAPPAGPYADELGVEPGPLRVALSVRSWSGGTVDPEVAEATVAAARLLEEMGHDVDEAGPEVTPEEIVDGSHHQLAAVAAPYLMAPVEPPRQLFAAVAWKVIEEARSLTAMELLAGFARQNALTRKVGAFFTRYDLLVTPTLAWPPAPHGSFDFDDPEQTTKGWLESIFQYGPFTMLFNVSGQPAISLPLGQSRDGLPIGVQFVAPYGREDLLFRLAARYEEAMPWRDRVPPHHVAADQAGSSAR